MRTITVYDPELQAEVTDWKEDPKEV